ncbi:xanthine dehydrogenase accessory protein XdhC [Aliiglaciecola sp. LCG003]|uniref:xanthine dehydrogenase accessory protein XdhC n=1 Tax=Aliiglaciecola sp. LCG003 TaxID=3053655 RepID=UPI0025746EF7|nr:xanthine dehydrogenase accessory protein XdhC [Aliiglaciecola sp. LCG003]WJG11216.1 xanthine dehydrogenase accessory protein XdhC [Aliiglaciecola sp. LCG003]
MSANHWFEGIQSCQQQGRAYVLLTLLGAAGSTPRAEGTKMVVCVDAIFDTIGGGQLEHLAIAKAREILLNQQPLQHMEYYPLAAKLAQCCGGATHVLFELIQQHASRLTLFGAGHVAKALIPIISQLPLQIDWVDERQEMFDGVTVSSNVRIRVTESAVEFSQDSAAADYVLIMTHNHQLDYQLATTALQKQQCRYVGVIGSQTKAKRFNSRLRQQSNDTAQLAKFICPVGLTEIPGKRPIEVAVSVAAQLIQLIDQHATTSSSQQDLKIRWQQTKEIAKIL